MLRTFLNEERIGQGNNYQFHTCVCIFVEKCFFGLGGKVLIYIFFENPAKAINLPFCPTDKGRQLNLNLPIFAW